jgi:hypothetical protein
MIFHVFTAHEMRRAFVLIDAFLDKVYKGAMLLFFAVEERADMADLS